VPASQARLPLDPMQLPSLATARHAEMKVYLLADVEQWVENNLKTWSDSILHGNSSGSACDDLTILMKDYWDLALSEYSMSPLEKSLALLTLFEMWVALDTICVEKVPLLRRYSPELQSDLLQPLLLPKLKQMQRLLAVEKYIDERNPTGSPSDRPSVFASVPTPRSFSTRYYDSSESLQDLHASVEKHDVAKRAKKVEELTGLTKSYTKLVNDAKKLSCESFVNRRGRSVHDRNCTKCRLNKQAKSMTITVDEKSLPQDSVQLKAVVFELAVPVEIAAWRDATWMVLHDVAKRKSDATTSKSPEVVLSSYPQLKRFHEYRSRQPRITITSSTKSFLTAHYKQPHLPTEERSVCLNNGLKYSMYDRTCGAWLSGSVSATSATSTSPTIKVYCTEDVPPADPYTRLHWACEKFDHKDNTVLARQNECHEELDLREYVAFGSLRAGEHLQWLNILRELGCSNLNHNAVAVSNLFRYAACEAGTPNKNVLRSAHTIFSDTSFCLKLISVLQRLLTSVETNWNEQYSMSTTISLTSRLLSLTSSPRVVNDCLQLLRKARSVAFGWYRYLKRTHLHTISNGEDEQQKGSLLLLGASLLCFSTLDVEEDQIEGVLNSVEDLACVAEIHNTIHDHLPNNVVSLTRAMRQSLLRRYKLAQTLEPRLRALVARDGTGLNQAIQELCNGATLDTQWIAEPNSNGQWLQNNTVPTKDGVAQPVHYNILTGALLVDGRPVGKLPDSYKAQSFFQRIFGSAVLDVFASDMPGMLYRVSHSLHGNEVSIQA